ncbi:PTS sugar transporter subunit IIA, partial [Staphylococcus epidermidis]|uniref:PTS sugar transporter subunit IIA n=1 Tax=Staphylococcus epidermidis TaxID=1282 RepID=UPI0011A6D7DA
LTKETIGMDLDGCDKSGVISEVVNELDKGGKLSEGVWFKEGIDNGECESRRGIGEGIGIRHGKVGGVKRAGIGLGKCKEGVDYESLEMEGGELLFMIGGGEGG